MSPVADTADLSPGAIDWTDAIKDVARFVRMPNDPEALDQCEECLKASIRKFNSVRWKFTYDFQDIPLVATQSDYTGVNAALKDPRHLELVTAAGTPYRKLYYDEPDTFLNENQSRGQVSSPSRYTLIPAALKIMLNKAPSAEFVAAYPNMRLWMWQRIQFETDGKLLATPEVCDGILWEAKKRIASIRLPDRYSIAASEAAQAWKLLRRDDIDENPDFAE